MKYLLDTCSFIWLAMPQGRLSRLAEELIDRADAELFLSDVSQWEVVMKNSAGKLPLPDSAKSWIPQQIAYHQLRCLPLETGAIYRSGELPRLHADPFDRLLAAQAMENGMTILSPDTPLSLLGASRIW